MKENFIIVENVIEKDLLKVLQNFAKLYSSNDFVEGISLLRKKQSSNSFIITFSKLPDFEIFCFLVNYIKYPEGFKRFTPFIRGYTTVDFGNEKYKPNSDSWKMVYVSKNDKDYDNVNLVTDKNESYLFDFGGKVKRLEHSEVSFHLVSIDNNNFSLVHTISIDKTSKKGKSKVQTGKRKVKDFFVMLVCLGFTCIGIFLKMNGLEEGWGGIVLFGFGFIFMLLSLIYPEKFKNPILKNRNNVG